MKTLIWISVAIFCTALMLGCGNMQPEVPPLEGLAEQFAAGALTDRDLRDLLVRLPMADIQTVWGQEAHRLSGFFGLVWPLDEGHNIILYFSPEQTVEDVRISERSADAA